MIRHHLQMMQGEGAAALAAAEAEQRKNSEETAAKMSLYASEIREQALREAALLFQAERLQIQAEAAALVEAERLEKQDYNVQADAMRVLMAARAADRSSSSRRQLQSNFDQAAVGGCGGSSKDTRSG